MVDEVTELQEEHQDGRELQCGGMSVGWVGVGWIGVGWIGVGWVGVG